MALNRRQLIELARLIEERRAALAAEVHEDVERTRDVPREAPYGSVELTDLSQAEVTRDLTELRGLEAARARLGDGSYGLCVDCGADIPFERLRAQPAATRCLGCQERHERTYRS